MILRSLLKTFILSVVSLMVLSKGYADNNVDGNPNNGLSVEVELRHRVIIPQIIYFRVGSATPGVVDKVTIDLTQTPRFTAGSGTYSGATNPLGDGNPVDATDNGTLDIDIRGNVGSITISYEVDNALGLSNGSGRFIDYDQIETISSDDTNLPAPVLDNNGGAAGSNISVTILGNQFGGRVVNRQAQWTYRYKNEVTPVAGTYTGRVSYTAASL